MDALKNGDKEILNEDALDRHGLLLFFLECLRKPALIQFRDKARIEEFLWFC